MVGTLAEVLQVLFKVKLKTLPAELLHRVELLDVDVHGAALVADYVAGFEDVFDPQAARVEDCVVCVDLRVDEEQRMRVRTLLEVVLQVLCRVLKHL